MYDVLDESLTDVIGGIANAFSHFCVVKKKQNIICLYRNHSLIDRFLFDAKQQLPRKADM